MTSRFTLAVCAAFAVLASPVARAASPGFTKPLPVIADAKVKTDRLGGVDVPSHDTLRAMHTSQYILRAANGQLTRVPVEKIRLPHSEAHPQATQVDLGANGVVYVRKPTVLCKSTDGGRTWTSTPIRHPEGHELNTQWKVLRDGTLIAVSCELGATRAPASVWASKDEGATWEKRAELLLDMKLLNGDPYGERYTHRGLERLQDDTLIYSVDIRATPLEAAVPGMYSFRSTDGGHKWQGPNFIHDWGSEGGSMLLPSGRVFATIRYQRPTHESDPPDLEKTNGSISKGWPWKHVFVMDSSDGGATWSPPRQLVTVFGQTFGYPAAQKDGTVVVVHDTRYGPGPPGSRAMVSRDEGQTWLDEVYYVDYTTFTGSYSASIALEDDTILTIAGSTQAGPGAPIREKTDFYAIRWKPVK